MESALPKSLRTFIYIFVIALLLLLIYAFDGVILILCLSILAALIFEPVVNFLEKKGLKRFQATLVIFVLVGLLLYILLAAFIPKITLQMNALINALNKVHIQEELYSIDKKVTEFLPFIKPGEVAQKIQEFISSLFNTSFEQITGMLTNIFSTVIFVVIVPFITFFLIKDSKTILKNIINLMPNRYYEMSYWIMKKISQQLGRFVRGWLLDATFVGISCGIGFSLIGIENSFTLGVIAGVGHLVPYLGPVIGGIPAALVSIVQYGDFSSLPLIILVMLIVYILDNGFVQPYVFAKSVDMHPVIIILLILIGSELFGVFGMLLAVPAASVIRTSAKEIYFALKNYKIARL